MVARRYDRLYSSGRGLSSGFYLSPCSESGSHGLWRSSHRTEPKTKLLTGPSFNSFENMEVEITGNCDRTKLHWRHRHGWSASYCRRFQFWLVGDESTNSNVRKMKDMLLSFNLIQHVLKPTHTSGHVLDYIISPSSGELVIPDTIEVSELISDHAAIICSINCSKPNTIRKEITYRQLKKITMDNFVKDVISLPLVQKP